MTLETLKCQEASIANHLDPKAVGYLHLTRFMREAFRAQLKQTKIKIALTEVKLFT